MKAVKKIKTIDKKEFLDSEFEQRFKNIFRGSGDKAREVFEETMSDRIKTCFHCKRLYWAGCQRRCECELEITIKK